MRYPVGRSGWTLRTDDSSLTTEQQVEPLSDFPSALVNPSPKPRIGVLAIQGDFAAHAAALRECGAEPVLVRKPEELTLSGSAALDGLVLPGGESTTVLKFLERDGFLESLAAFVQDEAGLRNLRRMHSAGAQRHRSSAAEPGRAGYRCRAQCVRAPD